ncbi:hypothetical protein FA13DRAFT_903203 [Coprinellus micaceus]|uniref:Uncharacterized protein n=1 Tax=Coprinellus micaceus TaxID=71717 RepID=A0A4Y7TV07_COPMI|nr:hypothetical protein FA13DRAFT_903203 [Coprinellus micaceus]
MWVVTDWITYFIVLLDMWLHKLDTFFSLDNPFVFRFSFLSLSLSHLSLSLDLSPLLYSICPIFFCYRLQRILQSPRFGVRILPPVLPPALVASACPLTFARPGSDRKTWSSNRLLLFLFPAIYECNTYTRLYNLSFLPCIAPWSPKYLCHMSRLPYAFLFSFLLDLPYQ